MPRAQSLLPKNRTTATPSGTPLAPSVEKAYYRKCIQLKRRLNEVEAANEEATVRRTRLDRAIMKMRLERAFLLEQMGKRMAMDVEGSEASGGEGPGTPPPDRPHRDKRRRNTQRGQAAGEPAAPPTQLAPHPSGDPPQHQQRPLHPMSAGQEPVVMPESDGQVVRGRDGTQGDYYYLQQQGQPRFQPPSPYSNPQGAPTGVPGAANGMNLDGPSDEREIDRRAGVAGEALSAGPEIREVNGERRVVSGGAPGLEAEGGAGFTAVNQDP